MPIALSSSCAYRISVLPARGMSTRSPKFITLLMKWAISLLHRIFSVMLNANLESGSLSNRSSILFAISLFDSDCLGSSAQMRGIFASLAILATMSNCHGYMRCASSTKTEEYRIKLSSQANRGSTMLMFGQRALRALWPSLNLPQCMISADFSLDPFFLAASYKRRDFPVPAAPVILNICFSLARILFSTSVC